ncbi:hypothetical protein Tco_0084153 [Tanacetum coccineum]
MGCKRRKEKVGRYEESKAKGLLSCSKKGSDDEFLNKVKDSRIAKLKYPQTEAIERKATISEEQPSKKLKLRMETVDEIRNYLRIVDFEKSAQDKESLEGISMITELQVIVNLLVSISLFTDVYSVRGLLTLCGSTTYLGIDRRYPLSRELMIRMLEHGMEVEDESEIAITLIHLFILWTTEDGDNP